MRRWLALSLVVIAPLAGGCTKFVTKQLYNNADTLILQRLDGYFDLSDQQEAALRKKLPRHLAWHRSTQLPAYVQTLRHGQKTLTDGMTSKELEWLYRAFFKHRDTIYRRIIPDAAQFLATLSSKQVVFLEKKMKADLEEQQKRIFAASKEERRTRVVKSVEDWFGDLSPAQIKKVHSFLDDFPDGRSRWIAYQRKRQKEFIVYLNKRKPVSQIEKDLAPMMISSPTLASNMRNRVTRRWLNSLKEFLLKLDSILTQKQRIHFRSELQELIENLQYIRAG